MTFLTRCLRQPRKVLIRKIAFQIHLWIGLAIGLYVVVLSLTGSALVFRREMDRAFAPDRPVRDPARQVMSVEELTEAGRRAYPDYAIATVGQIQRRTPVIQIDFTTPAGETVEREFSAYTGEDLGDPFPRVVGVAAVGRQPARRPAGHPRPERTVLERHRQHSRDAAVHHRRDHLVARHRVVAARDIGQAARRRGSASTSISTARWASGSSSIIFIWALSGIYLSMPSAFMAVVNFFFGPQPDQLQNVRVVDVDDGMAGAPALRPLAQPHAQGGMGRHRPAPGRHVRDGLRHVVEPRRQEAADGARAPAAAGAQHAPAGAAGSR